MENLQNHNENVSQDLPAFSEKYERKKRRNLRRVMDGLVEGQKVKMIPLTKKKIAIIDVEDYPLIEPYNWCTVVSGKCFYATTRTSPTDYSRMARLIMGIKRGDPRVVDHINQDTLDNRRKNLRVCTHRENSLNRCRFKQRKFTGVYKSGSKFRAEICPKGKTIYLGTYSTEKEAALAYNKKASEYFGEFAQLNAVTV